MGGAEAVHSSEERIGLSAVSAPAEAVRGHSSLPPCTICLFSLQIHCCYSSSILLPRQGKPTSTRHSRAWLRGAMTMAPSAAGLLRAHKAKPNIW